MAILVSCAQVTPPSQPDPPTDAPTALVYGMAASPIYEALKSRVRMTVSNGSQNATDFDLIILDGDGFSGEQLSSDEFIREAIHSNVWVLALDAVEEDKNGLGKMLHASSQGGVGAYLVRQAENAEGHPGSRLIDFVNPDRRAEEVAQSVVGYITEQAMAPQQANIPPRALTYQVHHTSDYSGLMPNVTSPSFGPPGQCEQGVYWPCSIPQTATWVVDHYITVLLNAGNSPFGDSQFVVVETAGRADPGRLASNYTEYCYGYAYACEIAWFQTRFDASHTIAAGSTPSKTLILEKTSPTTANNVETVTTTSSLTVNFSEAPGVSGSYNYSKTDTKTIRDWEVNDVSNNAAQWQYASNTVYDGMNTDSYDPGAWTYEYWPKPPNNLSLQDLEYNVKSSWNNNTVSADTVNIGGTDSSWYTDAFLASSNNYPGNDDINNCSDFSCHCMTAFCVSRAYMARHNNKQPWNIVVNLAAVIPVPTKSLTFSPNPAVAGQSVMGTLTLSAPTPIPAEVLVSSDKPGISPEHDTYTIPANEDTLTFNVVTGAEGCEPESATIKTFYADGQNQSLTVNPPPNCK